MSSAPPQQQASASSSNRCVFFEIFKNFINTIEENFTPEQLQDPQCQALLQQNQYEQQQAAALPISPFIIHQLLRKEGFATKILIFGNGGHNNNNQQQQQDNNNNQNIKDVYVRSLVQFETEEEAKKVLMRYGNVSSMMNNNNRQGSVVFLQNIPCLMLRVRAKPSRDGQVFVTDNSETSLVVTPEYFHFLGPDFPRTSNNVHEQNVANNNNNNVAMPEQQQQQTQQQQHQVQFFENKNTTSSQPEPVKKEAQKEEILTSNRNNNDAVEEQVTVAEETTNTTTTRARRRYQAPGSAIRQREE